MQVGRQAVELAFVDEQQRDRALVLGENDGLGRLVVAIGLDDRERVLGGIEHAGLQRLIDLAEIHRRRDRAEGRPDLRLDRVVHHADLGAFQLLRRRGGALARVDVAHAGRIVADDFDAEILARDQRLDALLELRIVEHALVVIAVLEQIRAR